MDVIKRIITSKSRTVLVTTAVYIIVLGFLRWRLSPDISTVLYLIGGVFGIFFLDGAEHIFRVQPSPFRSVVFLVLFAAVSFFIVSSSGNMLATGLVLSLYIQLLFLQIAEWNVSGNLASWYRMVEGTVSKEMQIAMMVASGLVLIIESVDV
jgi:hypothetical protein